MAEARRSELEAKVFTERKVYESKWVDVVLLEIEPPNGSRFEHHVIRLNRVIAAAVVNDQAEGLSAPGGTTRLTCHQLAVEVHNARSRLPSGWTSMQRPGTARQPQSDPPVVVSAVLRGPRVLWAGQGAAGERSGPWRARGFRGRL